MEISDLSDLSDLSNKNEGVHEEFSLGGEWAC